jgi:uncharacterized protein YndB with AHSA1/START domain
MNESNSSDRIEKKIHILAPRSRVWQALSDQSEFGTWFGATFPSGQFTPGQSVRGKIKNKGYEQLQLTMEIVDVIPETQLSYRWHPYAIDPDFDYSSEPTTLITFTLEDADGGTLLTVVESGFDQVPLHRRAEALQMNDRGWTAQLKNIERHVTASV